MQIRPTCIAIGIAFNLPNALRARLHQRSRLPRGALLS
jgi:hypothetical protein